MESEALGNHLFAAGGGLLTGALAFLVVTLASGHPLAPEYPPHDPDAEGRDTAGPAVEEEGRPTDGAGLYALACGACHQVSGEGLPGAFPPLKGSEWVSGDPETLMRIALLGVSGKISVRGEEWNATMPPPVVENDEELAKILSHVRQQFGGGASAVTGEQIAKVRQQLGGRTEAWTAAELSSLRAGGGSGSPAKAGNAEAAE